MRGIGKDVVYFRTKCKIEAPRRKKYTAGNWGGRDATARRPRLTYYLACALGIGFIQSVLGSQLDARLAESKRHKNANIIEQKIFKNIMVKSNAL